MLLSMVVPCASFTVTFVTINSICKNRIICSTSNISLDMQTLTIYYIRLSSYIRTSSPSLYPGSILF